MPNKSSLPGRDDVTPSLIPVLGQKLRAEEAEKIRQDYLKKRSPIIDPIEKKQSGKIAKSG